MFKSKFNFIIRIKSIKDCTKVIELEPTNYQQYYHRGLIYRSYGKIEKAIEDWEKVIEINPEFESVLRDRITEARTKLE